MSNESMTYRCELYAIEGWRTPDGGGLLIGNRSLWRRWPDYNGNYDEVCDDE